MSSLKEPQTLLLAVSLFLLLSYFFGSLFSKLKQPKVISEVLVGLFLGPSIFGWLFPDIFNAVFSDTSLQGISTLKNLGLILLMFCSGYEIKSLNLKQNIGNTFWTILLGIGIPSSFGYLFMDHINLGTALGNQQSLDKLKLILILSAAVTSIPVISRIFMDLDLINTSFAKMILSTAIAEDLILYSTLNVVLMDSTNSASMNIWSTILKHLLITAIFLGVVIFGRSKIYGLVRKIAFRKPNLESHQYVTLIFSLLLLTVYVFDQFGIVSMISSFACGIIVASATSDKALEIGETIKRFSFATFIPIYFIMVGFKINLPAHFSFKWVFAFLMISSFLKIAGGFLAGKISKFTNLKSFLMGITLNARGGPGIVIATTALEAGIINESLFVTLIITALTTSSLAGSILKIYQNKISTI